MPSSPMNSSTSTTPVTEMRASSKFVNMDLNEQRVRLFKASEECRQRLVQFNNSSDRSNSSNRGCEMVWDNILCWDEAPRGTLQRKRCPDYINGFNIHEFATKLCSSNGKWYTLSENGKHWTNYTACHLTNNLEIEADHGERLKLIQTIGYGVSLCSLLIAVILMFSSRLKSKSNTLHVNLFIAFILRASLSFAHKLLFVNGLGLKKDVERKSDGTIVFIHEGIHWECRLLQTTFMYTICASQMWIFVEGFYLHMLIYKTLSTERNGVRLYILLGWALPTAVIVPWVCVKALADNTLCWNVTSNPAYIWILHGPMLTTVLLNFVFFLNISRVLCSRVRSSQRHVGRSKYRHLVKFILVLIPLFGVFYIVLAVGFPLGYATRFDMTQMYVEQTYNSFQGFLLALLFCFLNEEVHSEIKRLWWRRRTFRRDSVVTRSYAMSSLKRNSSHTTMQLNVNQSLRPRNSFPSITSIELKQPIWLNHLKTQVRQCLRNDHDQSNHLATSRPIINKEASNLKNQNCDNGNGLIIKSDTMEGNMEVNYSVLNSNGI